MNNTNINKPKNASTLMGDFFPKRFLLYLDLVIFMVSKSEIKHLRQKAEICLGHRLAGILESGINICIAWSYYHYPKTQCLEGVEPSFLMDLNLQ